MDVVANYIDRAMTATSDNRPDFQRMIKDSYKHCFDMIIVWKLDRFSRDRYDSAHYKHILKKNGVKVLSCRTINQYISVHLFDTLSYSLASTTAPILDVKS